MMLARYSLAFALLATFASSTAAVAGKKDNSIRFAYDQAPENVAPYFNNVRIGVIIGHHVWDTLIHRDPMHQPIHRAARDGMEVDRRQDARNRAAPRSEIPRWRRIRGRGRCLHLRLCVEAGKQVRHHPECGLDRSGRQARQVQGADRRQVSVSGGDRVSRRAACNLSARISREEWPPRHERETGRYRPLPRHRACASANSFAWREIRIISGTVRSHSRRSTKSRCASFRMDRPASPKFSPTASTFS